MATVTARAIVWNTNAGNKTTAAFTPAANDLLVCISLHSGVDAASTITDSQGGSWVQVGTLTSHSTSVAGTIGIYLRTTGVSASSMTVTSAPGGTSTGGGLAVLSVARPSSAGPYGSSAYRQEGFQEDQAAGTPAPTMPAAAKAANTMIGVVCTNSNSSANCAPPSGWTEAYDLGYNTPATGIEVCYRESGETNATITFGAATPSQFGVRVIEIVAANADAEVSWAEFEVPSLNARADVSWAEFEVPTANARADVSWAEFEVPTADARADVSWAEFEVPAAVADADAEVSWAEFEVPTANARADVSWAEFEVPTADANAEVSWAEFEVPLANANAEISWTEFEVPALDANAEISWAEFEVPDAPSGDSDTLGLLLLGVGR